MAVTTEVIRRVYDDKEGVHISTGPDADGLDLINLFVPKGKSESWFGVCNISMNKEIAKALGEAFIASTKE